MLEGEELKVVVEVGLATLLHHGALPFVSLEGKEYATVAFPLSDTEQ
jgi:hypothetical protein